MPHDLIEQAIERMQRQRFGEALPLLHGAIEEDPSQWNAWYMAGQCCRFLNDIDGAITHLARAAELKADGAPVFLALGIAYQLQTRWADAVEAFRQALNIDPDYELGIGISKALGKDRGGPSTARSGLKCLDSAPVASRRAVSAVPWTVHKGAGGQALRVDPDSAGVAPTRRATPPAAAILRCSLGRGVSDGRRGSGGFSLAPPRALGPWAAAVHPVPGGSGSSRSPVARGSPR